MAITTMKLRGMAKKLLKVARKKMKALKFYLESKNMMTMFAEMRIIYILLLTFVENCQD